MRRSGGIGRRGIMAGAAGALAAMLTGADAGAAASGRRPGGEAGGAGKPHGRRAGGGGGQAGDAETRGVWLATVANRDWPSKPGLTADQQRAELLAHLDTAVERRLNTFVFQVRPTADALWPSSYEPWAQYLTGVPGKDPGWDPLGTAVTEAHRRGLELHAWFNPYRVATHTDPAKLAEGHPARLRPHWVLPYGGKLYYNPGLPEVRRFVQDAMLDAVRRYDIDAVHFDDYFYPYPVAGQVFDDDAAYAEHGSGFPGRAAWRRNNIDLLVSEMSVRIKEIKPDVAFGISPFGVWRNADTDPLGSDTRAGVQTYDDLYADTRRWVREGWIDHVVPQLYWNIGFAAADYAKLVPWWNDVVHGTGVTLRIGEALYKAGATGQPAAWQDPAELSRHLTLAAEYENVDGHVFFAAKEVMTDRIGAMARVVADHYPAEVRARPRER
ncbi:glycoside hydrolase family 10 protein [Streptomyces sp. SP18CS02]|uniref:glycoside hydrolase family 10 protein n=1 Tax=Streptomyces sp. SP18CS02 TaxID=3002531 RepID=UPI002E760115|nr:family 10 glycosylhydrolase [Streptomyces sp. SP18CS02]MEE1752607.1 family 10 glycosylhydrolase [Streptomyces sp. SP18CS02]